MFLYCNKIIHLKRVIVSVTNDLVTDQRVAKVCNSLIKNNFDVLLIGRKRSTSKPLVRKYPTKRFQLFFNSGFLFYAEYNLKLFFYLLFLRKDILVANDLDTLLPNYLVGKFQRKKIVFDSHELFSEVPELVNRPRVKKVWLSLESWLIPNLKNKYTVCASIANYYREKYDTNFETIKNLPNKKELIKGRFSFDTNNKKIILYQGAINVGRGLELLIEAMNFLEEHLLVIIGDGDIYKDLTQRISSQKLNEKVLLLGPIAPKELQYLTPLADLGISLEEDLGLNYRFALPNKIFDYIQGEVPILVSNLPEMKAVVLHHKVGEVLQNRDPKHLSNQIIKILNKDFTKELKLARETLVWEKQEAKLMQLYNNLK